MITSNKLEKSLISFLSEAGVERNRLIKLGPSTNGNARIPETATRMKLLSDLAQARTVSRTYLWISIGLVLLVFVFIVGLAIYHRDDTNFIAGSIFSGSGVIFGLLMHLRSESSRQISTQVLLALLPNLPAEHWTKCAMVLLEEMSKHPDRSKVAQSS